MLLVRWKMFLELGTKFFIFLKQNLKMLTDFDIFWQNFDGFRRISNEIPMDSNGNSDGFFQILKF